MPSFTVEADGQVIPFEAPAGATDDQLRILASRALRQRFPDKSYQKPVLERGLREKLMPRKDQGSIRATPETLAGTISDKITGALAAFGMDERGARRWGNKTTAALADFTPVGAATEADEARRAWGEGNYLGAAGHSVMAAVNGLPGGGLGESIGKWAIAPLWHGSPHKFDKFALDKIGTGEGAQAYGHGLYFAENRRVAEDYRDTISSDYLSRPDGSLFNPDSLNHLNVRSMMRRGDLEGALAKARAMLAEPHPYPQSRKALEKDLPILEDLAATGGVAPAQGNVYEVKLDANPEDFLDWDAGMIRNQLPNIRERLEPFKASGALRAKPNAPNTILGNEEIFRQAGIPGIRYLDRGSRGAGNGTRNYVVFDDSLIDIVGRY